MACKNSLLRIITYKRNSLIGISNMIIILIPEIRNTLREHRYITKRRELLWNPSYCVVTVSDRSREQVEKYIESQKENAELWLYGGEAVRTP